MTKAENLNYGGGLREGEQRSGTWTCEEKEYAESLMEEFLLGHLDVEEGISMRQFLANTLCCSPKRISKKQETGSRFYSGSLPYKKNHVRVNQPSWTVLRDKFCN